MRWEGERMDREKEYTSGKNKTEISNRDIECIGSIEEKKMGKREQHSHFHKNGHVQEHEHMHTQEHFHSHTQTKAVLNRMSRIIGHMEAVKKMVEDGRDCSEVLVQISAVRSALNSVGKVILKDHLEHCIVDAVRENDAETMEELKRAIDKFL